MATGRILAFDGPMCTTICPGSWYPLFWNPEFSDDGTFLGIRDSDTGEVVCSKRSATDPQTGAVFEVVIVPESVDEDISALETFK
jgi:hypothetical protein